MLIKNKFLILFIILLLCLSFTKKMNAPCYLVEKDPVTTISNYLNSLEIYCEQYKDEHRIYIEDQLLIHPSTYFANDINGIYNSDCEASLYFLNLKENKVKVTFEKDFKVETCQVNGEEIFGTKVVKNVKTGDGTKKTFNEFIELREINNQIKIVSTTSDLFQNYDQIACSNTQVTQPQIKEEKCQIYDLAESEYAKGNRAKALEYYKLAISCHKNIAYIKDKIKELDTVSSIKEAIKNGNTFFEKKQFNQALTFYNLAKESEAVLTSVERSKLTQAIKTCRVEIAFETTKTKGDYYYKKEFYDKALPAYQKALEIKPKNAEVIKKKTICEEKINGNYTQNIQQAIARAQKLIEQDRKYEKGVTILMKYRQSGHLKGKHLFYMAQVIDNPSTRKQVKKKFNLKNKECCVLVRQLVSEIENIDDGSVNMENFYFFKSGLNKRSLRCK